MEDTSKNPVPATELILNDEVTKEFIAAKLRFTDAIDEVDRRYSAPDSALYGNEPQISEFKDHYKERVLRFCIEEGSVRGISLDSVEMRALEFAAIWHDARKADKDKDVKGYTLVAHGMLAAQEVRGILESNNKKFLKAIFGTEDFSNEEAEMRIAQIKEAIECHMGPNPGFMANMLKGVNSKLPDGEKINHPYPRENNLIAQVLLAADMADLAGYGGRKKVMLIRESTPVFIDADRNTVSEYKGWGIDLTMGEAALLSGFDSANEARDMIQNPQDRKFVGDVIESTKDKNYSYNEGGISYNVSFNVAEAKRAKLERLKKVAPEVIGDDNLGLTATKERKIQELAK